MQEKQRQGPHLPKVHPYDTTAGISCLNPAPLHLRPVHGSEACSSSGLGSGSFTAIYDSAVGQHCAMLEFEKPRNRLSTGIRWELTRRALVLGLLRAAGRGPWFSAPASLAGLKRMNKAHCFLEASFWLT